MTGRDTEPADVVVCGGYVVRQAEVGLITGLRSLLTQMMKLYVGARIQRKMDIVAIGAGWPESYRCLRG